MQIAINAESIELLAADPLWGPSSGGTAINISVFSEDNTYSIASCQFRAVNLIDTHTVEYGARSGTGSFLCISPPFRYHHNVMLQILLTNRYGEQRLHPKQFTFNYIDFDVASVQPNSIVYNGNHSVSVTSQRILDVSQSVTCVFDLNGQLRKLAGDIMSNTTVNCIIPGSDVSQSALVGLQISNNVIGNGLGEINLLSNLIINNIYPLTGSVASRQTVYIEGLNIFMGTKSVCRFQSSNQLQIFDIPGRPLSPTLATCTRPNMPAGDYNIYFSNDGLTFATNSNLTLSLDEAFTLLDISPDHGPIAGQTLLSIHGYRFPNGSSLYCSFTDSHSKPVLVPATFVSTSLLTCISPKYQVPTSSASQTVQLNIKYIGSETLSAPLPFTYMNDPVVTSVSPTLFYKDIAGPDLVIQGSLLFSLPSTAIPYSVICRFNSTISINATLISNTKIVCPSPSPMSPGSYRLSLSWNRRNFIYTGFLIWWWDVPIISSISPTLGPIIGGTRVYINLQTPLSSNTNVQLICRFGTSQQLATFTFRNSTTGFCISPQADGPGVVPVSLYVQGLGQHGRQTNITYEYHWPISAFDLLPAIGTFNRPTAVFIRGPGVFRSDLTKCMVAETQSIVHTMFLSSDLLLCQIPPGSVFSLPLQSAGIHISLTNAPILNMHFKFNNKCPRGQFCFSDLQFMCPAGADCPDGRRTGNFSLCPPGQYQPESGQTRCLPCPIPFICPDYGIRSPEPCPSGYVCLNSSAVLPATRCPPGYICSSNTFSTNDTNTSLQIAVSELPLEGRFRTNPIPQQTDILSNIPVPCGNGSYCLEGSSPGMELPCQLGANCVSGEYRPEGPGTGPGLYSPSPTISMQSLCPRGHYCPGRGNAVPVPCPRGTYSDIMGLSYCKTCPRGYICPYAGMQQPIPCANGLLCDTMGLLYEQEECPSGFYCQSGFAIPCPPGTYCLSGVQTTAIQLWNFSTAQSCLAGTWCQEESPDAYGSGFCPPGHYCPVGSPLPIAAVPGQFVSRSGMIRSLECPPGRFSAGIGVNICDVCPSGYTCPYYGMIRPIVCPRGYYRTQDEGIDCEPCPPGTWSDVLGLVDQSQCSPCPSGKVCGVVGMYSLSQASSCVEGYVCDQSTYPAIQFDVKCPEGYACPSETTLASMYEFLCPPGYICVEGTPYSLRNLYRCPPNRYCPRGTYRRLVSNNSTNHHTFVQLPGHSNDSRPGDFSTVWDKFWTVCQDQGIDSGDPNEPCDFFTVETPLPDGTINIRYSQVCPLGTESQEKSIHIEDCTVIPGYGPATLFSPVDLNHVDDRITVEIVAPVDYWFLDLEPLDLVVVDLYFSNIPTNITYLVHWQLSLYTDRKCQFRRRMPITFESSSTPKTGHQQLTVGIREPTSFTWRLEIIHGISLWAAMSFVNTTRLTIQRPNRALLGTRDTFMAVISLDLNLELPLNLPRSDETDLSISYTSIESDGAVYNNATNTTSDVYQLIPDSFSDVFVSRSEADDFYANPFMPYVSNCRGFDSYLYFFQLFESDNCSLVDEQDTKPVAAINFGQSPVADECYNVYQCEYEEILSSVSIYSRWYQATSATTSFYITATPIPYQDILKGTDYITTTLADQIGNDFMIPVMASSLDPNSDATQVPRIVRFVIEYQQVDERTKKIITASLYFDQFDPDRYTTNYTYQFEAVLTPLGYSDLVNRFAFPFQVYFVLFVAIGSVLCAGVIVYWFLHKIISRVRFSSRFQLWDFLKISESKPLIAVGLFSIPILIVMGLLYLILVEIDVFGSISGKFEGDSQISVATARVYRGGRLAVAFITLGMYQIFLGSLMFIPKKVRRVRPFATDDKKHEEYEAAVHEAGTHDEYHDHSWQPRVWKRFHFASACLLLCTIMVFLIEFSYSDTFANYTVQIILFLKVLQPAIDFFFESLVQEKLLTSPLMTTYGATTFVMTMGAPDLTGFVTGFITDTVADVIDTVYFGPATDYLLEKLQIIIQHIIHAINSALKRRAARLERERRKKLGYVVKEADEDDAHSVHREESEEEIEEVIEPVIEAFNEHATCMIGFVFCPFILILFILFRQELLIPITYNIRENDMHYYLLFAVVMLPFLIIFYAFLVNVMELFHGFKTFSYLKYCEFKFLTRGMRWQACETNMDMGIEPQLRSLHQFSFSAQYSFTTVVTTMGMILVIIGVQAMIRQQYNMFADPITPIMIIISMMIGIGMTRLCQSVADLFGLWRIKNRFQTLDAQAAARKIQVTDWEEIEHMAAVAKIQLQEDMRRIETPRLVEDAFRTDFIKYNRQWLVSNLQQIVSPRNVRRDRSRALAQLGRVLLTTKGAQQEIVGDNISSDSSSGDDFAQQLKAFKYAKVNTLAQKVGTGWLMIARWRLRLRELYAEITQQWLLDHSSKCNRCDSIDNVLVESDPSLDHLVNRYHHMDDMTTPETIDSSKWKNYLDARAEFIAICKRCLDEQEELKDALTKLSGATRKIATMWLQIVRQTLKRRKQEAALRDNARSLSDDEESDNELEQTVRHAAKDVHISEISEQIYQQWLDFVRLKIIAETKEASGTTKVPSSMLQTIEESSSESDYEYAGLDAGNKNVVGPVSDLTDQMIQFWIDDARLALYCQRKERNKKSKDAVDPEQIPNQDSGSDTKQIA